MIPPKEALEFFAKGNFAFEKELVFQAGGPGAPFHRTPASFTGRLVQLFKDKTPLEKSDSNFLRTAWAPLTISACRGIFRTLQEAFSGEMTHSARLEHALSMFNSMGWGKVQIVESDQERSVFRLFHSFEDKVYFEKRGKAPCPVSAYTAGMLLGAHLFSLSQEPNHIDEVTQEKLISVLDTFEQERCEAEGQPYGEFVIVSRR